jgi:hypothetical protein
MQASKVIIALQGDTKYVPSRVCEKIKITSTGLDTAGDIPMPLKVSFGDGTVATFLIGGVSWRPMPFEIPTDIAYAVVPFGFTVIIEEVFTEKK